MPELRIPLDPCNPGQFYACCGIVELFEMLSARTRSHFELDRRLPHKACFVIETETTVDVAASTALLAGARCEVLPRQIPTKAGREASEAKDSTAPLQIHLSAATTTLDWWLDEFWSENSALKLWAGNQSSLQIWTKLCGLLPARTDAATIFEWAEMAKGRFGVDPRSAWEALDLGYSPNEQNHAVRTYPAVEILAAIGLQTFRPKGSRSTGLGYCVWRVPLPAPVARSACMQPWDGLPSTPYAFRLEGRGSYKYFSFAERATSAQE